MKARTLAKDMFNAYNEQGPNPWKTWDGKDVPKFNETSEQVRMKWTAAAQCALNEIMNHVQDNIEDFLNTVARGDDEELP